MQASDFHQFAISAWTLDNPQPTHGPIVVPTVFYNTEYTPVPVLTPSSWTAYYPLGFTYYIFPVNPITLISFTALTPSEALLGLYNSFVESN